MSNELVIHESRSDVLYGEKIDVLFPGHCAILLFENDRQHICFIDGPFFPKQIELTEKWFPTYKKPNIFKRKKPFYIHFYHFNMNGGSGILCENLRAVSKDVLKEIATKGSSPYSSHLCDFTYYGTVMHWCFNPTVIRRCEDFWHERKIKIENNVPFFSDEEMKKYLTQLSEEVLGDIAYNDLNIRSSCLAVSRNGPKPNWRSKDEPKKQEYMATMKQRAAQKGIFLTFTK